MCLGIVLLMLIFVSWTLPYYEAIGTLRNYEILPYISCPILIKYWVGITLLFDFTPNFYAEISGFEDR